MNSVIMAGCDPFLAVGDPMTEEDPLSACVASSSLPTDWLMDPSAQVFSPPYPEELLDVTGLLGLDDNSLAFSLDGECRENCSETFQELKFTSTPKSKQCDSGILEDWPTPTRSYKTVLHDITDKFQHSNNDSFVSLSDVADNPCNKETKEENDADGSPPSKRSFLIEEVRCEEQKQDVQVLERNVSIIRKRIKSRRTIQDLSVTSFPSEPLISGDLIPRTLLATSSNDCGVPVQPPESPVNEMSEEEVVYYTGVSNHTSAVGLLKFIRLPKSQHISSAKKALLTLMKLRLNLQWKDLSFRFAIPEDVVRRVFNSTLDVLSYALTELIPWQLKFQIKKRIESHTYYLHTISSSSSQVVLLIHEGPRPILFVSGLYPKSYDPLSIVLKERNSSFRDGDILFTAASNICYRLSMEKSDDPESKNLLTINFVEELSPRIHSKNILNILHTIKNMNSTFFMSSMEKIPEGTSYIKVLLVCVALTNINLGTRPSTATYKRLYERSASRSMQISI